MLHLPLEDDAPGERALGEAPELRSEASLPDQDQPEVGAFGREERASPEELRQALSRIEAPDEEEVRPPVREARDRRNPRMEAGEVDPVRNDRDRPREAPEHVGAGGFGDGDHLGEALEVG